MWYSSWKHVVTSHCPSVKNTQKCPEGVESVLSESPDRNLSSGAAKFDHVRNGPAGAIVRRKWRAAIRPQRSTATLGSCSQYPRYVILWSQSCNRDGKPPVPKVCCLFSLPEPEQVCIIRWKLCSTFEVVMFALLPHYRARYLWATVPK